jgi:hypothetical protein
MTRLAAITVLCSAALAPAARADILYLTQERFIQPMSTRVDAPGFGFWGDKLFVRSGLFPTGFAKQDSWLDPQGITVRQHIRAQDGSFSFYGVATSSLDVTFSLSAPSPVEISGLWEIDAHVGTGTTYNGFAATFELTGAVPIYLRSLTASYPSPSTPPLSIPLTYTGVLAPGTYRLRAISYGLALAQSYGPDCEVRLNATILIPAPASAAALLVVPLWARRRRPPR